MFQFLRYYLNAKTKHSTKSIFAKSFLNEIWEDDRYYYVFDDINDLKLRLKQKKKITWNGQQTNVKSIFQKMDISTEIGQKLFYIAQAYQSKHILEIGNGLNSIWMLQAVADTKLHIIEPNNDWTTMIKDYINHQNWQTTVSTDTAINQNVNLKSILPSIDIVIVDLKVQHIDTVPTFEKILPYLTEDSMIIIINKNLKNQEIWELLKKNPKTKLTLDFYQVGFVFFKSKQPKVQHLQLIHNSWKPWSIKL